MHWTDRSRIESLAPDRGPRELMVDIWYPAERTVGPVAAYLERSAFEQPVTAERLKGYLRAAYEPIKQSEPEMMSSTSATNSGT